MKKSAALQWHNSITWSRKIFFKYYIKGIYYRIDEHHVLLLSSALAFSFFVCIIPLMLIIFSIIGNIFAVTTPENNIGLLADKIIPYQESADFVKKIIINRIEEFKIHRTIAGYLGIVGLLFGASSVFSSMRTILNTIFHMQVQKNPIFEKLKDFGMVLFVLLFFLISMTLLPGLEIILNFWEKIELLKFLKLSSILKFLFSLVSVCIFFAFLFLMYYLVPSQKIPKRVAVVSSLVATALWEIAIQLFGFYISNFPTLGKVYGTYLLIIVVAFWIYYSSVIFIIGAEVGDLYHHRVKK